MPQASAVRHDQYLALAGESGRANCATHFDENGDEIVSLKTIGTDQEICSEYLERPNFFSGHPSFLYCPEYH